MLEWLVVVVVETDHLRVERLVLVSPAVVRDAEVQQVRANEIGDGEVELDPQRVASFEGEHGVVCGCQHLDRLDRQASVGVARIFVRQLEADIRKQFEPELKVDANHAPHKRHADGELDVEHERDLERRLEDDAVVVALLVWRGVLEIKVRWDPHALVDGAGLEDAGDALSLGTDGARDLEAGRHRHADVALAE